ncbi:MAG: RNA polymerase sigma factor [bacterium]
MLMRARQRGAMRLQRREPGGFGRARRLRVLLAGGVHVRAVHVLRLRRRGVRRFVRMPAINSAGGAMQLLVENHSRFLDFLERRVGSREVAEDILQDAYLRGIDKASALRDLESATAWFYRLLRNALVDHYRKRGAEERAFERLAVEMAGDEAGAPADAELFRTVCACVTSLLETLRPEYARALRRVEVDEKSVREFADEEAITPNNAAVRLHRARAALRRQLIACCGTCATHACLECDCRDTRNDSADHDASA